jgi:hypothetical protein
MVYVRRFCSRESRERKMGETVEAVALLITAQGIARTADGFAPVGSI